MNKHIVFSSTTIVAIQIIGIVVLGSLFGILGVAISFVIGISAGSCYSFIANRHIQNRTTHI